MIYKVKAKIIEETISEFYRKLADGTVAKQRPDGEEITASMERAVLTAPGVAEWYEKCFCPTPLYHERQTQYVYFTYRTTWLQRPGQQGTPNQALQPTAVHSMHLYEAHPRKDHRGVNLISDAQRF